MPRASHGRRPGGAHPVSPRRARANSRPTALEVHPGARPSARRKERHETTSSPPPRLPARSAGCRPRRLEFRSIARPVRSGPPGGLHTASAPTPGCLCGSLRSPADGRNTARLRRAQWREWRTALRTIRSRRQRPPQTPPAAQRPAARRTTTTDATASRWLRATDAPGRPSRTPAPPGKWRRKAESPETPRPRDLEGTSERRRRTRPDRAPDHGTASRSGQSPVR